MFHFDNFFQHEYNIVMLTMFCFLFRRMDLTNLMDVIQATTVQNRMIAPRETNSLLIFTEPRFNRALEAWVVEATIRTRFQIQL